MFLNGNVFVERNTGRELTEKNPYVIIDIHLPFHISFFLPQGLCLQCKVIHIIWGAVMKTTVKEAEHL